MRVLTAPWGAGHLLDGGHGTLTAATLPTDAVPRLAGVPSLLRLALTAAATAARTRRCGIRHGRRRRHTHPGDVGWHPCTPSGRPG
ncbi:hypothetical protein ACFV2N_23280 [Streptomyces sp. NPDC059680]|uniref:hypothetical protein n=1 Tax=Streptomyces sp. NPDC059680 TaxID=3346904 RepID=UPI0036C1D9AD